MRALCENLDRYAGSLGFDYVEVAIVGVEWPFVAPSSWCSSSALGMGEYACWGWQVVVRVMLVRNLSALRRTGDGSH